MSTNCDRCSSGAVIFIRYSGQHLCGEHFLDLIRKRVRKESRAQNVFKRGPRIGIALSGGKDSLLTMKLLHEISEPFKDRSLVAITIDEGISGYRPSSVEISRKTTKELQIEWQLLSYSEIFGIDLDEMVIRSDMGPCSICGILRRKALNLAAVKADCDILVTGHNLDDVSQTILMNIMSADVQRFARMGPHLEPIQGFVPRAMVLRTTPETETYLAAHLMDLPLHDVECPYAQEAHRGSFRDIILNMEMGTPGTRHSLLRFHEQISSLIPRNIPGPNPCKKCDEPVVGGQIEPVCKACKLLEDLGVNQ